MTRALERKQASDRERARKALHAVIDQVLDTTGAVPNPDSITAMGEMLRESLTESAAVDQITDELGPYLTGGAVRRRAGRTRGREISRQALLKRRERWAIIGVPTDDHSDPILYPVRQFTDAGTATVLPGVREVASTLATGINDPLTVAVWLNSPNPDLDDTPAYDWLRAGRPVDHVLDAARRDVRRWRQ